MSFLKSLDLVLHLLHLLSNTNMIGESLSMIVVLMVSVDVLLSYGGWIIRKVKVEDLTLMGD